MHIPVLLDRVIEFLNLKDENVYVDATLGCGGYTKKILELANCKVIGIDWDKDAIEFVKKNLENFIKEGRLILVNENFIKIKEILEHYKIKNVAGIVFDFGLSSLQLRSNRGFSFKDESFDMRMSKDSSSITAYEVVNNFSFEQLVNIFLNYGEEKFAKKIAKKIIEYRKTKKIQSAKELAELIEKVYHRRKIKKKLFKEKETLEFSFHPATKVFQAIRIFINDELKNIELGLKNSIDIVIPSGRVIAISYHSLEDRIVKNIFKSYEPLGFKILTPKPITPSKQEIINNKASRSAKLRCIEKL